MRGNVLCWLYGAQLQRDQLRDDQLAMMTDFGTLLALRAAHADVLHTNLCHTELIGLNVASGHNESTAYTLYVRYTFEVKAIIVVANEATADPSVELAIGANELHTMGFGTTACFSIDVLFGQGSSAVLPRAALAALPHLCWS